MSKKLVLLGCIVSCIFIFNSGKIYAEDQESSVNKAADWRQKLASDRQAIKEQRGQIKEEAQASRAEEKQLRDQIKTAMDSGDMKKAHQLRQQLRATHKENVQQMIQDKKEMKTEKRDFKKDVRDARHEGNLPPRRDKDNNPPGPKGGPGTNWENPPGPKGGPGTSPNKKPMMNQGAPRGGGGDHRR